jgi:hypothetical protein
VYAKYYFALRSMSEQGNFRQRYMATIAVGPSVKRIEVGGFLLLCSHHVGFILCREGRMHPIR